MSGSLEGLLIGRTLAGRYLIEEVIGRGGMSLVYRAGDERLGRPVAVKIVSLPAQGAERADLRARLRREAASAASIPAHPNVVHVYDYGTDSELDLDFIVMELLTGRDLKAAMAGGMLGAGESLRVLREAARGIAAGHRAGIVHRDVKPANIYLVGADGLEMVKILDFGIAKALEIDVDGEDDLTRTGVVPHSPAYASPEQLASKKHLSAASDVYQLGLVAYELLAGERPFTEDERARIRTGEEIALPERGRWSELPEEARDVIGRALRTKPEERYQDAAAFAEAIAVLTDPLAPAAPHVEPREPAQDATLAMAPSAGDGGIGDDTAFADEAIPELLSPDRGPPGQPGRRSGNDRGRLAGKLPGRRVQLAAGLMLALVGFWAISRLGGEPAEPSPAADVLDTSALDEEFRPLMLAAARAEMTDPAAEGQAAVDEIRRVIVDMNDAWVRGDLDRHVAHYADRVRFYGDDSASRGSIARDRGGALERYPEREITIERTAISFPQPGRARALVDKSWSFGGGDAEWEGSARQELILELSQGVWQVVSEQDVEVYRNERRG